MSELAKFLKRNGFWIENEQAVGPDAYRIRMNRRDLMFMIDYHPNISLMLSVAEGPGAKNGLAAARKACTQFMGAEPICRYKAKVMHHWSCYVEWNLVEPEQYLRKIVNGGDGFAEIQIKDLVLLGGYSLSDFKDESLKNSYADSAKFKKDHAGIYGMDPGECDVVRVSKADEFGLFLEYTLAINRKIAAGDYPYKHRMGEEIYVYLEYGKTIEGLQAQSIDLTLDFLTYVICQKANIRILRPPCKEHRLRIDQDMFTKWYNFYGEYFLALCPTDESRGEVIEKYYRGEDVSMYAAKGSWR